MDEPEAIARIAHDLRSVGLEPGGVVLVHSSLKSLGHVPGGPETVVRGLLEALGPAGTLLMPALSYATVGTENPVFDVMKTPSCVGAIPEHFRTRAGTLRSVSPTHSVCGVGPQAARLLERHHLDETPGGANSPFRALRDAGGWILMLGCGLAPSTSMHAVEELVKPPYLFGDTVTYRVLLVDGTETRIRCRRHAFRGFVQRYDRIAALLPPGALKVGTVLSATVHLLDCAPMWEAAERALRADPFHFVERRESA
jgi:aminoglycoside 3-N-acetyltransferase